jgi:hypothetical protein
MRTLLLTVGMVCLAGVTLVGQDSTKVEVFGGYQFFHAGNFDGAGDSANANGFDISGTVNLRKQIGFTADFGYAEKGPGSRLYPAIHISTYTFGPTASFVAGSSIKLFAHALFGVAHSPTACYIYSGSPDECGSGYNNGHHDVWWRRRYKTRQACCCPLGSIRLGLLSDPVWSTKQHCQSSRRPGRSLLDRSFA